jgi:hypothetical protein
MEKENTFYTTFMNCGAKPLSVGASPYRVMAMCSWSLRTWSLLLGQAIALSCFAT